MHIGFATQNPTSHYWMVISYGARERAAELGIELTITPSYTQDQQLATIHGFIEQRPDALLIGPHAAQGLAGAVGRARAAGIPVIVLAAELTDCSVTCTVRSDHTQGAELAASYLVEQLGGAGEVAHIVGPSRLQDNVDRAVGVRRVIGQHQGVQIVFERESPDWRTESGATIMREALERHPQLRGVCVANDTLALGAIQAIGEAGRTGQVIVTGFDAAPDALIAIHEGRMGATVRQSIRGIGRAAVDVARQAALGEAPPSLVLAEISLITRDNLLDATLESVYILPDVLRDAVERGEALTRARDEIIEAQKAALQELSTPLIPLSDKVVVMPLVGTIDSGRAQQVLETLLEGVSQSGAAIAILDITGVAVVDTQVANALIRASQAVKLLGAQVVLTGIRPEVAQTLVGLGVELSGIITLSSLQSGIAYALARR